MFLEIILSLLVGFLGVWFYTFWRDYRYLKSIPATKVWPLVGNALDFGTTTEILPNMERLHKKFNSDTLRFHLGLSTMLVTKDYKLLEFILSSQTILSKGLGYRFMHEWLGLGLLTSDGEKWRSRRKMITPTFHFQILEQFIEVFNSKGNIMIEKLKKEVGNKSVDIFPYVTLCALDIICETAMGTCVNVQKEDSSEYAKCVNTMGRIIESRGFSPFYQFDFIYRFSKLYQEEKAALKVLHGYTNTVITKRRAQLGTVNNTSTKSEDDVGQKKKTAFLDMLLQANIKGVPLSDQDIREEVDTFMFEGHDTTASGISFTLFCLANHPEVQQRAFEEQLAIFGDDIERECTYQDVQEMKYLELVLKESQRVYPSVPFFGRRLKQDVSFDGIVLPKGLTITISIYGIHKDPKYYSNPEKFDPDRFNTENYTGKQPYAYIPFSAGMRNCIGQKFAMLEMKAEVGKILRNFELKPATPIHHVQLAAETVTKPANGVRIGIEKRKY